MKPISGSPTFRSPPALCPPSRLGLRGVALTAVWLVAACQPAGPTQHFDRAPVKPAGQTALPRPSETTSQAATGEVLNGPPSAPTLLPGTGVMLSDQGASDAAAEASGKPGDITLNFVDADVREVVRSVLGDVLHLNYSIDSKVQATVTVQTSRPLRRDQVLPTLQEVLRSSGLALVESGGVYRVVPIDEAARNGAASLVLGQGPTRFGSPTYNVQIFPLKFASAAELQRTIEPLLPKGALIQVDPTRNLLIISGTGQDLSTATELVRTFDVDYLRGMSFGIFPLQTGSPRTVVADLNSIFGPGGSVPLSGVLRFAPLERMNAVLAISPQRSYLDQARRWIERLDLGSDENTPRLYQYHVQNSRAADLAKVLSQLFTSGQVRTVDAQPNSESPFTKAGPPQGSATMSQPFGGASPLGGGLSPLGGAPTPLGAGTGLTPAPLGQGGLGAMPAATAPNATSSSDTSRGGTAALQPPALANALGDAFNADKSNGPNDFDLPQVRIVADEKNNTLVIFARPRHYRMIEDTLKRIDVLPLQVLIEATIAEVTLNDDLQYGLQWFFQGSRHSANLINTSPSTTTTAGTNTIITPITPANTPAQIFPGFNYQFLTTGANVVLNALSALTTVNVVSSPQLLVLDHHEASLQVGDEVPVPTAQAVSTLAANAPIVNTIEYLNTGVILHVSPRVNSNGVITLDISQEVSNVTGTGNANLNGAPTISQRRVETTVSVADGETIALGGLIQDSKTLGNSGIPLLGNIPVLGSLFSTKTDQKSRTELLVLLSPRVLHNAAEVRSVTEELRNRLHTIDPVVDRVH